MEVSDTVLIKAMYFLDTGKPYQPHLWRTLGIIRRVNMRPSEEYFKPGPVHQVHLFDESVHKLALKVFAEDMRLLTPEERTLWQLKYPQLSEEG